MSRWLLDENDVVARGGEPAESAHDQAAPTRSGAIDRDGRAAGMPRLRDDPAGRRSLTGLEFRRQRSSATS
jgi:hypothetical protein